MTISNGPTNRDGWLWPPRRKIFAKTLERLFRFAGQAGPAVGERTQTVVLTIGTVGPGGSERQVVNTALALAAEGRFRPIVVCTNLGPGVSEFYRPVLEEAGIELVDLKKVSLRASGKHAAFAIACGVRLAGSAFFVSIDAVRLMLVLLRERPCIVHSFLDETNIKSGIAGLLARVPRIVMSMRSVAPSNFSLHAGYMLPGYQVLLARPEVVVCCNSKAGAADYRRWLGMPDLPIAIVENGIDFGQFARPAGTNAADRTKFGLPHDALVLGSIMRLTEEKQPVLWAKAAVEISRQMPNVHFVLAGDGPLKNEVMQIVSEAGIESRVHLLGRIKDIPSVLNCLDLLVLTSRLEGLPNVLIEAQAMGVPVVTTPAGGAVETLDPGRTGLITPDQTVSGVAQTCLRLLGDDQMRSQMSRAAPEFVRGNFSMERMLQKTLTLYAG